MSTPLELMREYRNLSVTLDPDAAGRPVPAVRVDVHQYIINREISSESVNTRRVQAAAMYDQMSARINQEIRERNAATRAAATSKAPPAVLTRDQFFSELMTGLNNDLFNDVKYGKASPEVVAVYLRLAVRYGFATASSLQTFADTNIGLDCSGFVSNFWVRENQLTPADADSRNARSYNVASRRRASLAAIRDKDVLVWADGGHIGVIDGAPRPLLGIDPVAMRAHQREVARQQAQLRAQTRRRRGAIPPPAPLLPPIPVVSPEVYGPPAPPRPILTVGAPGYVPPPGHRVEYACIVVESNAGRGLDQEEYRLISINSRGIISARRANGSLQRVYVVNWDGGD